LYIPVPPCPLFTIHDDFIQLIASLDQVKADAVRLSIGFEEECNRWRVILEQVQAEETFFTSLCGAATVC